MGGRARRLRLGRRQRERRGEEEQGAGADGTRRAADQRHRAELLPLLCPVLVAGFATAVSRGARDAVQQAFPVHTRSNRTCDMLSPLYRESLPETIRPLFGGLCCRAAWQQQ